MKPPRIIYHPAPSPALDGGQTEVRPVDLGRDPKRAIAWIRRRLGLLGVRDDAPVRFENRRLPDAPAPEAREAPTPAGPPFTPMSPERRELSSDELLTALEADPRLRPTDRRD
jgi:hypothetical protein